MKATNLSFTPVAIALSLAPALPLHAQQTAGDALASSTVEVVGRRSSGTYFSSEASGTKSDLPLRELPQAVRVMSRQSLDDLGAVRLDDALDYVGGVSRQNNFGGLWDNFAVRGLAGDMNNGMSMLQNGFSANRGFNAPRDTANIERIEFLKGTSAALYGASEPGGTVNIVTKRPLWRPARAAEVYAGNHDFYRAVLDATGPLSAQFAYRVNAALEHRGSFRDHVGSRRQFIAPALAWRVAPGTRLDYRGEYLRHAAPMDRGVVAVDNRLDVLPRSRFLGEPADGDIRVRNLTHQLVLEHELAQDWQARIGLNYKDSQLDGYSTEAQPSLQADQRTLRRQRRYRDYASEDLGVQAELTGRLAAGGVAHELMVGVEAYRLDLDQRMLRANPSNARPYAIDIFAPVYGQPMPQPLPNTDILDEQRNLALYVQDSVKLGARWRALAGVRVDRHEQTLENRRNGKVVTQEPQATSPRLGVSYLASPRWTVFANAGRSFRPNTGADAAGEAFAPERGSSVELGTKWESAGGDLGATLALFDIRKRNMLTTDALNPNFSTAAGEVRSRGLDLDLSGQFSHGWRGNASLSYVDAEVLRDNALAVGGPLLNVPRLNGSLMLLREALVPGMGRVAVGGAVTYSAGRLGEPYTGQQAAAGLPRFELPSYALARLVAYWQVAPRVRLSLDVDNLFDRRYYTNSVQRTWVTPGPGRGATLGLQTTF